jgi:histidyl-tRNA synthetase
VLQGLLQQCAVPPKSFGPVCVVVDKAEKITREEVVAQLAALGLPAPTIDSILLVLEVGVAAGQTPRPCFAG